MNLFDWFHGLFHAEQDTGAEDNWVQIIIGLGNPGPEHEQDRHNAGFWFVDELAARHGGQFRSDAKFRGEQCQINIDGANVRLLKPATYMNRSGQAVRAIAAYLKVAPEKLLIVHDEIDLPPGVVRIKQGGGHGGHNGLRDIISHLGGNFARLRLGVGHPGQKDQVVDYVLKRPSRAESDLISDAIRDAADVMPVLVRDGFQKAMHQLHSGK